MEHFKSAIALIVAVVSLVATGVLIAFLFGKVGDENWDAYVYLLAGVEAVAFAAAGWLFGKEVHREQAENAESDRKAAEKDRVDAESRAATEHQKGVEVARGVLARLEDMTSATATGAGADEATRANSVVKRIVQSAYPGELTDF